jgi:hypothetical protein
MVIVFAFSRLREDQKKNRRMGISAGAVTIWASSARRVPRNDPNFVRILAWATLRCVIPKKNPDPAAKITKLRTRRAKLY